MSLFILAYLCVNTNNDYLSRCEVYNKLPSVKSLMMIDILSMSILTLACSLHSYQIYEILSSYSMEVRFSHILLGVISVCVGYILAVVILFKTLGGLVDRTAPVVLNESEYLTYLGALTTLLCAVLCVMILAGVHLSGTLLSHLALRIVAELLLGLVFVKCLHTMGLRTTRPKKPTERKYVCNLPEGYGSTPASVTFKRDNGTLRIIDETPHNNSKPEISK